MSSCDKTPCGLPLVGAGFESSASSSARLFFPIMAVDGYGHVNATSD